MFHELRTPLFNIKTHIETLHEYGEDLSEAERREFLETANHETDRLARLVNDVLICHDSNPAASTSLGGGSRSRSSRHCVPVECGIKVLSWFRMFAPTCHPS